MMISVYPITPGSLGQATIRAPSPGHEYVHTSDLDTSISCHSDTPKPLPAGPEREALTMAQSMSSLQVCDQGMS